MIYSWGGIKNLKWKGLIMNPKTVIKSQYWAALAMLREAIEKCPDDMWLDASYSNPFWGNAYHAIFFAYLYLHPSEEDYLPWENLQEDGELLVYPSEPATPYSKAAVLAYLEHCLAYMEAQVDTLDLEGESGFYWLPFNKLELQFYNIRHIQQHTGELCERLGAHGEIEVGWVGRKETD
jgi:hypothetical protein